MSTRNYFEIKTKDDKVVLCDYLTYGKDELTDSPYTRYTGWENESQKKRKSVKYLRKTSKGSSTIEADAYRSLRGTRFIRLYHRSASEGSRDYFMQYEWHPKGGHRYGTNAKYIFTEMYKKIWPDSDLTLKNCFIAVMKIYSEKNDLSEDTENFKNQIESWEKMPVEEFMDKFHFVDKQLHNAD